MVSKAAAQAAAAKQKVSNNNTKSREYIAKATHSSETLERINKIATMKIKSMEKDSNFLSKEATGKSALVLFHYVNADVIPRFAIDELGMGKVLGKGGFGTVKEIRSINCKVDNGPVASEDDEEQALQDKKFIANHCLRESGDARYCIKALSPEVIANKQLFTQGTIDMAVETMFLSVVNHPHIITLRAFGSEGMMHPNYFIILDRLYDTLEARIPKWNLQSKKSKSFMNKLKKTSKSKLDELMETKLCYAYDLTGAFEYMHKNKLVYRDLKPENVGFNIRDDIVLFDFGLAREVMEKEKVTDTTWKLTGETGSLRYMAPEVCANKPYGYSCDMYSFAIMLWEMLSCSRPFAGYSQKMHHENVVIKGGRPKIDDSWGPAMKGFLNSCWNQDLNKRPTAAKASAILKREAAKVSGASLELNNFRRKSTFVNRDSLRESRMSSLESAQQIAREALQDTSDRSGDGGQ